MPKHCISELDGFWVDGEHDCTLHIGYEDEDTLYFDLFDSALAADTPEGNECIASVMLNLKTGKATIVHCGGDK